MFLKRVHTAMIGTNSVLYHYDSQLRIECDYDGYNGCSHVPATHCSGSCLTTGDLLSNT